LKVFFYCMQKINRDSKRTVRVLSENKIIYFISDIETGKYIGLFFSKITNISNFTCLIEIATKINNSRTQRNNVFVTDTLPLRRPWNGVQRINEQTDHGNSA
jgi:hypothetical protein